MKMQSKRLAVIGTLLLGLIISTVFMVRAQENDLQIVTATVDTFTDRLQNTIAHDGQGLQLQSNDPAPAAGNAVRIVFMKFDLSGVDLPGLGKITLAKLRMPAPGGSGCPVPSPNMQVNIYAVQDDNWDASLVWGADRDNPTHPARASVIPLISLDQGTVSTVPNVYEFTDDTNDFFSQFLEQQRLADGVASLRVEISSGTGNLIFNDSEDSAGAVASCDLPVIDTPSLEVGNDGSPLNVSVRNETAQQQTDNTLVIAVGALVLLVGLSVSYVLRRKRRVEL
jgi:hypothetical protein